MNNNEELLANQLSKAKLDFPLLVLALNLTTAYGRFLEHFYVNRFRNKLMEIPIPDGDGGAIITWPPELEKKDIFQQLEEWTVAVIEAGAIANSNTKTEIRACPIIRQDYNAAKTCVHKYIEYPPQSDDEWDEYLNCLERLSLHASEMRSHNCSL